MKAIITAGGKGERLKPLTDNLPKPMIEVAGKPIIEHIINLFNKNGISDFIITLCFLPEKITDYFGNGRRFGVNIEYIYEKEDFPLGTAGNISAAKSFIDSTFIVTYADILRELNISDMIKFHKDKKAFTTLNTYKRFGDSPKSMIAFDKNKKITSFIERPTFPRLPLKALAKWGHSRDLPAELEGGGNLYKQTNNDFVWSNGSFYIFEQDIFNFIPANTFTDFGRDVFPKLLQLGKSLYAYPSDGLFIDIGNMEKLELARKKFARKTTHSAHID